MGTTFSPNIPFSVIAKRNSPPSITTESPRALTTDHLHHIKDLGKIATPRAVSFDVPTSTTVPTQEPYLSSMATTNPFAILSDDEDDFQRHDTTGTKPGSTTDPTNATPNSGQSKNSVNFQHSIPTNS